MRSITTEGFEAPKTPLAGPAPMLQWIKISDLIIDMSYQRPIVGRGRINVIRIARDFRWTFFAPVVVSPVEGGLFTIIDGQHRTTAAALCGFDSVPCQVVIAAQSEQAAAFKAINGVTTPITPMALYAAAQAAGETWSIAITEVCRRADVILLRYPIATDRQPPGQTMAVGALRACLRRYGADVLVTALQCVTQTHNNKPGILSARVIKALCETVSLLSNGPDFARRIIEASHHVDIEAAVASINDKRLSSSKGPTNLLTETLKEQFLNRLSMASVTCEIDG